MNPRESVIKTVISTEGSSAQSPLQDATHNDGGTNTKPSPMPPQIVSNPSQAPAGDNLDAVADSDFQDTAPLSLSDSPTLSDAEEAVPVPDVSEEPGKSPQMTPSTESTVSQEAGAALGTEVRFSGGDEQEVNPQISEDLGSPVVPVTRETQETGYLIASATSEIPTNHFGSSEQDSSAQQKNQTRWVKSLLDSFDVLSSISYNKVTQELIDQVSKIQHVVHANPSTFIEKYGANHGLLNTLSHLIVELEPRKRAEEKKKAEGQSYVGIISFYNDLVFIRETVFPGIPVLDDGHTTAEDESFGRRSKRVLRGAFTHAVSRLKGVADFFKPNQETKNKLKASLAEAVGNVRETVGLSREGKVEEGVNEASTGRVEPSFDGLPGVLSPDTQAPSAVTDEYPLDAPSSIAPALPKNEKTEKWSASFLRVAETVAGNIREGFSLPREKKEAREALARIYEQVKSLPEKYSKLDPKVKLAIGGALLGVSLVGGAPVASAVYGGRLVLRGFGAISAGKGLEELYKKNAMKKIADLSEADPRTLEIIEKRGRVLKVLGALTVMVAGLEVDILNAIFDAHPTEILHPTPMPSSENLLTAHVSVIDPTDDSRFSHTMDTLAADRAEVLRVQELLAPVVEQSVVPGDTFSGILQNNDIIKTLAGSSVETLEKIRRLTEFGKQNFAANIIAQLTSDQMKEIGFTPDGKLPGIGKTLNIQKLAEFAKTMRVTRGGEEMLLLDAALRL